MELHYSIIAFWWTADENELKKVKPGLMAFSKRFAWVLLLTDFVNENLKLRIKNKTKIKSESSCQAAYKVSME